ncbi:MAG: hypothetical protein ABI673_03140 [Novosphingobium sp.]
MTMQFRALAEQAMTDGTITAEEILALRREGWADGRINPDEAEALFVLNENLTERSPEWCDAFVEAITEFMIAGAAPRGYIDDAQAEWLINHIDRSGGVESMAELELLAKLMERAESVPERLKDYAIHQIEQAVLTGTGPTRDGGRLTDDGVSSAECRLLRRMIFAQAGERPGAVSQHEAEMLFRIKDATLNAANAPEWKQLFVQGVGNFLMAWSDYQAPSLDRAKQLDAFMHDTTPHVGRFFGRMMKSNVGGATARVLGFGRKGAAANDPDADLAEAAKITDTEEAWLQSELGADRQLDDLEQALLAFIAEG